MNEFALYNPTIPTRRGWTKSEPVPTQPKKTATVAFPSMSEEKAKIYSEAFAKAWLELLEGKKQARTRSASLQA